MNVYTWRESADFILNPDRENSNYLHKFTYYGLLLRVEFTRLYTIYMPLSGISCY